MSRFPPWARVAVALGLIGFVVVFQPWRSVGDRARAAAEGLRDGSVYVAPGAPGLVDPRRARQVIGDRAIVVAIFDDAPLTEYAGEDSPHRALCGELASLVPSNLVIVFAADADGEYDSAYCDGPDFPAPTENDDSAEEFSFGVLVTAELSWQYRVSDTDFTPEIEEYVLTFDAKAAEAYGEIPRRGPVPDVLAFGRLLLACAGMVCGTVVLFLLLRQGALALRRQVGAEHTRMRRRAAVDARLNRLADRILRATAPPNAQAADAAKEYVLTLHQFRDAHTDQRLTAVEDRIADLERTLR